MSDEKLEVLQGTLDLVVLKTLRAAGELHGFGVLDWIRDRTESRLLVEEGALYPALHRMQKRGWLESSWAISEKGRRAKYYTLTDDGREALEQQERKFDDYAEVLRRLSAAEAG